VPFSAFGILYVPSALVVGEDAEATARSITASEWLFRTATVRRMAAHIILVFLALALYQLLKPVNQPFFTAVDQFLDGRWPQGRRWSADVPG
jgi:hypothetical protein